jgi:hypothetical protein
VTNHGRLHPRLERGGVPAVPQDLERELPLANVRVVDDGSTDRTAEAARSFGSAVLSNAAAGGRVPVKMKPRAGVESKLSGGKAGKVIATVIGTLVAARLFTARRSR